jgi:hypothetical protein
MATMGPSGPSVTGPPESPGHRRWLVAYVALAERFSKLPSCVTRSRQP